MSDHPRLTRYIPFLNGTTFMGMLRQNDTYPELFGPSYDPTHGPYVLAAESDAEIERLRAREGGIPLWILRSPLRPLLRRRGGHASGWRDRRGDRLRWRATCASHCLPLLRGAIGRYVLGVAW